MLECIKDYMNKYDISYEMKETDVHDSECTAKLYASALYICV